MRIEEEYKRQGYFWLPDNPDNKIPGTLTIEDGGKIELEVVGHFGNGLETLMDSIDISRIIGNVEKEGFVTLENCLFTKRNYSFGGIDKSKLYVHKVFSGVGYDKDEPITFNTLSFSVDCLDEWVGITGISVDSDFKNRTAKVSYNPPTKLTYELDGGMKLEICFGYTLPAVPDLREVKITQMVYFKLHSTSLKPLKEFTTIAFKIISFLCFAIDDSVSIKGVTGTSNEIQQESGNGKTHPISIKIYYESRPFEAKVSNKSWHEMLFAFSAIKDNAQVVINNWINSYERISPALNLYFSTKQGAQKYLNGKFLALAQGLETYHRRTNNETLMDEEDFKGLVDKIIEQCPTENVGWLEGRLKYGNEINLGKRIKRIIEPFKEHLGNSKSRSKFIRSIVDTRNYFTHYSDDLKDSAAKTEDLWDLVLKMEAIFQLHFLKLIGFSDDEIKQVVKNSESLNRKIK